MNWINNYIAIGNYLDARERYLDFDAVLCLKSQCCDENNTEVDILCIPLIDGPGNREKDISSAIGYISDTVSSSQKILVHCHAGRSRSVCVVAAYFMLYQGMSYIKAFKLISSKREINLSNGIEEILRQAKFKKC